MRIFGAITIIFLLSACSTTQGSSQSVEVTNSMNPDDHTIEFPTPMPNQYSPKPSDDQMIRGPFYLDSYNLNIMESYPIQISLSISGSLPTPCHEFRVEVNQPDAQNHIQVELYSVMDPEKMCAQVLEPFEFNIPMGSFPTGHYTVWINGTQIGDFDS